MYTKLLLLALFLMPTEGIFAQKITLTKSQLLPLSHFELSEDYGKLIDGVVGLGDALAYTPTTSSSLISWPHKVLIDLKGTYNITKLRVHDGTGIPTINWYAGTTPFNISLIAGPIPLMGYDVFNEQNVTANGIRYIILEQIDNLTRFPSEIEIHGSVVSKVLEPVAVIKPPVDVKQILGSNGFCWETPDVVGLFTNYRLFTELQWFFTDTKKLMVSPANNGGVHFKNQLSAFKNRGVEPLVVLQNSPNYIMNKSATEHDGNYKPIAWNVTDYNTASNWREIAEVYYKMGAYLGSRQVPITDLNFNTTPRWPNDEVNVAESGQNLAKWIEILNEPDKNWGNPVKEGYFSPYNLAALMSAAYDGHEGTLGKAGVKTADPNLKIAMGGIYKLQVEYIKAMHEWAKANRKDGKFPADALNFHHYNNTSSSGGQGAGTGSVHPEEGQLITQMQQVIDYRNKYLPNLEIWLSEWGMSTNLGNLKVPELPSYGTREDVQGAWMIRTYLALMKLNIERSYMYASEDEDDANNNSLFGGVGIFKHNTLAKKKSYYYVSDFINLFKSNNFKLKSDLSTANVRDFVFEDVAKGKEMRFVWSPTGNETTVPNYKVNISGSNITGFQFTGSTHGIETYTNSNIITVTEIPRVFIYNTTILNTPIIEKKEIVLYPNPTSGKVYFNFPSQKITVYNSQGQELSVFSSINSLTEVDLNGFSTGIYLLKIVTEDNQVVNAKIIKE